MSSSSRQHQYLLLDVELRSKDLGITLASLYLGAHSVRLGYSWLCAGAPMVLGLNGPQGDALPMVPSPPYGVIPQRRESLHSQANFKVIFELILPKCR